MDTIDSAEAKKELFRIDKILTIKHLLIGGLAVKYYYPARESKDIDLVCSDNVRNTIIQGLYPSNEWDVFDENMDEYRPDYHIKNKKNKLTISFGPKIKEREPYKDISWELLLKEHSIPFQSNKASFNYIYIPNADALAYTKFISFINRQNEKDAQDLQDFIDLTNHKSCSLDVLFHLIDSVTDIQKLRQDFFEKISSNEKYIHIIKNGNIFKFANFFHESKISPLLPKLSEIVKAKKINIVKNQTVMFFSMENRPPETQFTELMKDTKKFHLMARTGIIFLTRYSDDLKQAIADGCNCKFIISNKYSAATEQIQFRSDMYKINLDAAYVQLKLLKSHYDGRVKIHIINHPPPFGYQYYEKNDDTKTTVIRPSFLLNYSASKRPMFMLKDNDDWYTSFYDEFTQLWEHTQEWGTKKRIIIDGAPGAGKTTLLTGKSQRDKLNREFGGLNTSGYTVFGDLIIPIAKKMKEEGIFDISDNWELFFERAVDRAIDFFYDAKPDLISFYDRGIFYLEIMAEKNGCVDKLPKKYYDFVNSSDRYDNPVFIFNPILSYQVIPHQGDPKSRNYTNDMRIEQHQKIIELYIKYGYNVIEIPVFNSSVEENIKHRVEKIKNELEI